MPKIKPSHNSRLKNFVDEFGGEIFSTDGKILYCKICETKVGAERKFIVQQHIAREKHKRGLELLAKRDNKAKQLLIAESASKSSSKNSEFFEEFCDALVSADIPLNALNNTKFRRFLEKYMNRPIPDESTLRKNYIPQCYNKTLLNIRKSVLGKKIFVSIDETNDVDGRNVANAVVGTMETEGENKVFLLNTEVLDKVNHTSICRFFDQSLSLLWSSGIQHEDVLLFVTDAAPYMVKAATSIKSFYPKIVHVTCLAHALHRVAEEIRNQFPQVDELVSKVKKIFIKAPLRREAFKSLAPDIPFPPEPIVTRWGSWLSACAYFCEHFEVVKSVVDSLESKDAKVIGECKKLFSNSEIKGQLVYIKANFLNIPDLIEELQMNNLLLERAVHLIEDLKQNLITVSGDRGAVVLQKLNKVLDKNEGFKSLCKISKVLSGGSFDTLYYV